MVDPAARDDERQRLETREAQAVDEPAVSGVRERVCGKSIHDPVLGGRHRQGIGGFARGRLDERHIAVRETVASDDMAPRSVVVRGNHEREGGSQPVDQASHDHVEGGIEAVPVADRSDRRCQRVGGTGWIELAHEASTSGSGGVPATRTGIARMIRVPYRADDLVGAGQLSSTSAPRARQLAGVTHPISAGGNRCPRDRALGPPDGRRSPGRRLYSAA